MRKACQSAAFFEETFHPVAERRHVLFGDVRPGFPLAAKRQTVRQILLDRYKLIVFVRCQIDDRKTTQRKLILDAIFIELKTSGKGVVCLLRHQ